MLHLAIKKWKWCFNFWNVMLQNSTTALEKLCFWVFTHMILAKHIVQTLSPPNVDTISSWRVQKIFWGNLFRFDFFRRGRKGCLWNSATSGGPSSRRHFRMFHFPYIDECNHAWFTWTTFQHLCRTKLYDWPFAKRSSSLIPNYQTTTVGCRMSATKKTCNTDHRTSWNLSRQNLCIKSRGTRGTSCVHTLRAAPHRSSRQRDAAYAAGAGSRVSSGSEALLPVLPVIL